jgi:hypothetical protein
MSIEYAEWGQIVYDDEANCFYSPADVEIVVTRTGEPLKDEHGRELPIEWCDVGKRQACAYVRDENGLIMAYEGEVVRKVFIDDFLIRPKAEVQPAGYMMPLAGRHEPAD